MARGVKWFGLTQFDEVIEKKDLGKLSIVALAEGRKILGRSIQGSNVFGIPVDKDNVIFRYMKGEKFDVVIRYRRVIRQVRLVAHDRLSLFSVRSMALKALGKSSEILVLVLEDDQGRRIYINSKFAMLFRPLPSEKKAK
ncbi:MAG: hypothetical protein WC242_05500 [Candidatus Paceibacterota bacterium]|jgi:hypothetical protein